jgi:hypothetical protein
VIFTIVINPVSALYEDTVALKRTLYGSLAEVTITSFPVIYDNPFSTVTDSGPGPAVGTPLKTDSVVVKKRSPGAPVGPVEPELGQQHPQSGKLQSHSSFTKSQLAPQSQTSEVG